MGAYDELRAGGAVVDPRRAVVRVAGPDATTFLQGQASNDLAALAVGASCWSWVLQPTGKVDVLVRATRAAADEWLLDTDAGWAERLVARLVRFRLRVRAEVDALDWVVAGVRAAGAAPGAWGGADSPGVVVVDAGWPGLAGVDLLGPAQAVAAAVPAGLPTASDDEWQAARIEAGIPVMGAELTDKTIPGETGLIDRTVSFTKGCYTGQELVARIDSRGGNVPRRLVGLRSGGPLAPGDELLGDDGAPAATLTSVATTPNGGVVALGYARRGVETGAALRAASGAVVEVADLPLVP